MALGLAIGIVLNLGGIIGQAEGDGFDIDGDGLSEGGGIISDFAESVGGFIDERGMIQIPIKNLFKLIKIIPSLPIIFPSLAFAATNSTKKQEWYHNIAFYIGGIFDIGFIYLTVGACLGGFGCLAGGGGIKIGKLGIGVLFPFWKWW